MGRIPYTWLAAAVGGVLTVDAVTKWRAPGEGDWTWHAQARADQMPPLWHTAVFLTGCVGFVLMARSIGFALVLAGVLGNVVWNEATGGVPNPFTEADPDGRWTNLWAYNVADLALTAGGLVACVEVFWIIGAVALTLARRSAIGSRSPLNADGPRR
jgi:hypothetical protein